MTQPMTDPNTAIIADPFADQGEAAVPQATTMPQAMTPAAQAAMERTNPLPPQAAAAAEPDMPDFEDPFADMPDLDSAFASAEAPDTDNLPDGRYRVFIERAQLKRTGPKAKTPGQPFVSLQLRVMAGECRGRVAFHSLYISDDPQRLGWLKKDLAKMGVDLVAMNMRLSEFLSARLPMLWNRVLDIRLAANKKNPEFQNVFFDAYLAEERPPEDLLNAAGAAAGGSVASGSSAAASGAPKATSAANVF